MPFKIEETSIKGLFRITPHFFEDERGYFIKDFEKLEFEAYGLPTEFYETNESKSRKGTLRGLHFQSEYSQGKLIRVIKGSVYDVAVDLRLDSETFGKWEAFELNERNHQMVYIPENFAHGFLTLENDTIFNYKCTNKYSPTHDSGILWNDNELNVLWPLDDIQNELLLSEKDKLLPTFSEIKKRLLEKRKNNE